MRVEELFPSEDAVDSSEDEEREVGETEEMEDWSDGGLVFELVDGFSFSVHAVKRSKALNVRTESFFFIELLL